MGPRSGSAVGVEVDRSALRFEEPGPSVELVNGERAPEGTLAEALDELPATVCICGFAGKHPSACGRAIDHVLTEAHRRGFVSGDANVRRAEGQGIVLERAFQDRVAGLLGQRRKVATEEVAHGVVILDICETPHGSGARDDGVGIFANERLRAARAVAARVYSTSWGHISPENVGLDLVGSRLPQVPRLASIVLALTLLWPLLGSSQEEPAAFLGQPDTDRIKGLRTAEISEVKKGKGGRSLAFQITLADGTRGYFKPKQTFSAAHWYSELAAYYLDRELGLGRVPPTTGRTFHWNELQKAAGRDERVSELGIARDGTVKGAFIWWIPEPLKRVRMGRKWERWVRIQKSLPITPYQRPVDYRADLNHHPGIREATDPSRPVAQAPDTEERPAELSDLIVFDYLTQNVDRWGGDFTNVRSRGPGGPLIYLDNGAGFWLGEQRLGLMEARLKALQRFRRSTIDAVRKLDIERFSVRLQDDPLAPVLNEKQLDGLAQRRRAVLRHVNAMVARFGETRVFAW